MKSLRSKILFPSLIGIVLTLSVTALLVVVFVSKKLDKQFNGLLLLKAKSLILLAEYEEEGLEFDYVSDMMPEFTGLNPDYFILTNAKGNEIARSESLDNVKISWQIPLQEDDVVFRDVRLPDGRQGRIVYVWFHPMIENDADEPSLKTADQLRIWKENVPKLVVAVAVDRKPLEIIRMNAAVGVAGGMLLTVLLIVFIVSYQTAKGLRPFYYLIRQVKQLDEKSLHKPIEVPSDYEEINLIVDQLNKSLTGLNKAFVREREFSSNVAHELRTPITELILLSDVIQAGLNDPDVMSQFFVDSLEIAQHMQGIVECLLNLARAESKREILVSEKFDLLSLVENKSVQIKSHLNSIQCVSITANKDSLWVENDSKAMGIIVSNLINNALSYSPPETTVEVALSRQGSQVELLVSNEVVDLEHQDLAHLADYFWRKETARSHRQHLGLGLSMVQALSKLVSVSIEFSLSGSTFSVRLRM